VAYWIGLGWKIKRLAGVCSSEGTKGYKMEQSAKKRTAGCVQADVFEDVDSGCMGATADRLV
jgi:hypothetical protein